MIQRLVWHCRRDFCVRSSGHAFCLHGGVHVANGARYPFADPSRGFSTRAGYSRFLWNFHDVDGVWWRYSVLLSPEDWLPEQGWDVENLDRYSLGLGPSIFPLMLDPNRIGPVAQLLGCRDSDRYLWSFRCELIEQSDFFTIQMGAHRTRMDDLHKPIGVWQYCLPFSHWLWRPGARYTETMVEPQALSYCDIEKVQPPKGHVGAYQIRGLDRSPVVVTPRADV